MDVLSISYRDPSSPKRFVQSLRETGFAVLTDHPIAHDLILKTYSEWETYFASEEKHADTFVPEIQAGYFPFKTEKAKDKNIFDLKEFFHYYPRRNKLPKVASLHTLELYEKLLALGAELLGWIEDHSPSEVRNKFSMPLRDMIGESSDTLLRSIHYPPISEGEEEGAIRAAAHEDINLITLLPSATAPGLEVKDKAGRWHSVDCNPGAIVINAGDMLQMLTEGFYASTTHRVMNPRGAEAKKSRLSMPLFLHPAPNVKLSERHTASSYLRERLTEIGLLKS